MSNRVYAEGTTVPAPDKDLCPKHAAEWQERQERKNVRNR